MKASPFFLALDTPDLERAYDLVTACKPYLGGIKIGMEFFYALGARGYGRLGDLGLGIFLDLKLHDIPNTVARGLSSLLHLDPVPAFVTVHVAGGAAMLSAACEAMEGKTRLLGVTVLTSLEARDFEEMGIGLGDLSGYVVGLAQYGQRAGLSGVVASAHEVVGIKETCGPSFVTMVPGIRGSGDHDTSPGQQDQKRVATVAQALGAGADFLVLGRAVTQAPDPARAIERLWQEVEGGLG